MVDIVEIHSKVQMRILSHLYGRKIGLLSKYYTKD